MKFFFNVNNTTQTKALLELGVKNILTSYRYMKNQIPTLLKDFDNVMLIPGKIDNVDDYYEYIRENTSGLYIATQYDVPNNMELTLKYYEKGRGLVIPILTQNYLSHLSRLKLESGQYICLGKMAGRIEEEEMLRKLPNTYRYHGMAKGRFIKSPILDSVDSSAWLSGVRGRKTEVFDGNSTFQLNFKEKATFQKTLVSHAQLLSDYQIRGEDILKDYNSLLKLPHVLYYIPLFKKLGIFGENYNS